MRMIVDTVETGGRTYELRMNRCGKRACSSCSAALNPPGRRLGHGPYWYLVAYAGSKVVRLYIGKELDTTLYVRPGGGIDWRWYRERGARNKLAGVRDPFPEPVQGDLVEEVARVEGAAGVSGETHGDQKPG